MKKVLILTLLLLSFAGTAFALDAGVATGAGVAVYGGVDSTAAGNAPTALIRFSTGVNGVVNFVADDHDHYAIGTKHTSGSKIFATTDDATNIYWKQAATGALATNGIGTSTETASSALFIGNGWTSY